MDDQEREDRRIPPRPPHHQVGPVERNEGQEVARQVRNILGDVSVELMVHIGVPRPCATVIRQAICFCNA